MNTFQISPHTLAIHKVLTRVKHNAPQSLTLRMLTIVANIDLQLLPNRLCVQSIANELQFNDSAMFRQQKIHTR